MKQFFGAYPDSAIMQQAVAQIPWVHNVALLSKYKDSLEREFYETYAILPQAVAQMDREPSMESNYANEGIKLA